MSNTASTNNNPLKEEGVVFPGDTIIPGIGSRENIDGTRTYFPKTYVTFFRHNLASLKENLTQEEVALVERVILNKDDLVRQVAYDHLQRWPTSTPLSSEQARGGALTKFYSDVTNDEFLFIATRSLQESEIVGAIRLNLDTKYASVVVKESRPARISVRVSANIDLCRGKTPLALRQMLAKVHDFFTKWASFREVTDRAAHERRTAYVSCSYQLTLRMVEDSAKASTSENWIYPTKSMLEEWGYTPNGTDYFGDESELLICSV